MNVLKLEKQLPQNLKALLQEIGESVVAFHLFRLTKNTKWRVFKNLQEPGCDLVMINNKNQTIRIEVKTRQSLYSTSNSPNTKNQREFEITKNEYKHMHFLVCYWLDYNAFFIIPKNKINSGKTTLKRRITKSKKEGLINFGKHEEFRDKWELIETKMNQVQKSKNEKVNLFSNNSHL